MTTSFNDKRQMLQSKTETLSNSEFLVSSQEDYTYRPDGALILHQSRLLNINLNLEIERIYGYKSPDISSNQDIYKGVNLRIYPNPATQTIQISDPKLNIHSINVFDTKGNVIRNHEVNTVHFTLERNDTPAGLYYLQIQTDKGTVSKPIIWID